MQRYLLIDGTQLAMRDALREALAQRGAIRLYADLGEEAAGVGPLLVAADEDFSRRCFAWECGPQRKYAVAELETPRSLTVAAGHLQALRYVHLLEHRKHFLRYADTRVLLNLLQVLTPAQTVALFGPVDRWRIKDRAGVVLDLTPPDSQRGNVLPLRLSDEQGRQLLRLSRPDQLLADVLDDEPSLAACGTPSEMHRWTEAALAVARARRLQWQPWEQALVHAVLRTRGQAIDDPAFLRAIEQAQSLGQAEMLYEWRSDALHAERTRRQEFDVAGETS